ncbi:YihY/virulence factor BrkB family protein [Sphingosinicella rhizophila]|uniref:YihY/virulence factor BrkB family protein n=1 Tax=Sphingosinicella rhizophila TaxID=3050082 RepID=A0ABU3Q3W2_9SPHN|nr:YihY/virulence factor BrkB family protein [Sphingosinicella sp. GR2756]MDT9598101.1 YihY/virulence factor BrkB family protein [Sphingosinicella sp. GR2756]
MQQISPESPEARRKKQAAPQSHFGKLTSRMRPGQYPFEVVKRVAVGVYSDGFIHAGNLAYLALLTLFPFVIVAAAVAGIFGQTREGLAAVNGLLQTMPPDVAEVLQKPIRDVIHSRSGSLLWLGAIVGLWTTGSFIETIRDIIRRAYGVTFSRPFWEYRLGSIGMIIGSVIIAMIAFSISILLSGVQEFVLKWLPGADELVSLFTLLRVVPALVLFGSLYLLFYSLTPKRYRNSECPKWPGPAFVTFWWLATTAILPAALNSLGGYDLTYGSLAGVIIALLFFFVIGLGVVIGAELNAALAETPEEALKEGEEAFFNRENI